MNRRKLFSAFSAFLATPAGRKLATTALAVVLALLGLTAAYVLVIPNPTGGPPLATVTIGQPAVTTAMVDGADTDTKRDDPLPLTAKAVAVQQDAAQGEIKDVEGNLRGPDTAPAGVLSGPQAAQEWPGCKTAFVKAFSSRQGTVPSGIAYHYTAGGNTAGWADLDGLTAYSNNLKNQVSWHFAVDREGHCTYNVPVNQKAWTIAGLNRETINFEIVGTGHEPDWAGTAGLATVARITARIHRLYPKIPIALGATDGKCHITRPGIITHWMGGPCSGGHVDVKPYSIVAIIAAVRALATPVKPAPVLYTVIVWKPGTKAVKVTTRRPADTVRLYTRRGFTRISVVRVKQK